MWHPVSIIGFIMLVKNVLSAACCAPKFCCCLNFFILGAVWLILLVVCGFRSMVLSRVVPSNTAESIISTWLFLTLMGMCFLEF